MVRPMFTRRFWSADPMSSYSYESNKPSSGSHELSTGSNIKSKAERLGFRQVKDPYNVSVLRTVEGHGSEEEIIAQGDGDMANQKNHQAPPQVLREQEPGDGIVVKREVDISTEPAKGQVHQSWAAV